LIGAGGEGDVTVVSRAPAGEAGFRLLAEHLPDLVVLAFDAPGEGTVVEARLPLTDPGEWRWEA
jgi:hypothetical protein